MTKKIDIDVSCTVADSRNPIATDGQRTALEMQDTYVSAASPDKLTMVDGVIFFEGMRVAFVTEEDYEACKKHILEKRHIN